MLSPMGTPPQRSKGWTQTWTQLTQKLLASVTSGVKAANSSVPVFKESHGLALANPYDVSPQIDVWLLKRSFADLSETRAVLQVSSLLKLALSGVQGCISTRWPLLHSLMRWEKPPSLPPPPRKK